MRGETSVGQGRCLLSLLLGARGQEEGKNARQSAGSKPRGSLDVWAEPLKAESHLPASQPAPHPKVSNPVYLVEEISYLPSGISFVCASSEFRKVARTVKYFIRSKL